LCPVLNRDFAARHEELCRKPPSFFLIRPTASGLQAPDNQRFCRLRITTEVRKCVRQSMSTTLGRILAVQVDPPAGILSPQHALNITQVGFQNGETMFLTNTKERVLRHGFHLLASSRASATGSIVFGGLGAHGLSIDSCTELRNQIAANVLF
jgi:hypothetical protein